MRTQTNKIRNERGTITTNTTEIPKKKKIIRKYYKHLYTNKSDYLEEMEKFLEHTNCQD